MVIYQKEGERGNGLTVFMEKESHKIMENYQKTTPKKG